MYLRKTATCHLQHKLIGFYSRYEKCLQRGTYWALKGSHTHTHTHIDITEPVTLYPIVEA